MTTPQPTTYSEGTPQPLALPFANPLIQGILKGLEPDEDLDISTWADRFRKLPRESAAEYGDFRTSRTPYLRTIMDCLSPSSRVKRVVVVKPTQIAATDGIGNNFLLYTAHKKPRPCLMILPTVELARRHSKSKVDKSVAAMECMRGIIRDSEGGKRRDESVLIKEFPGGFWMFLGSNSASAARSVSICNLILDDVDGFCMEMGDEGDPIDIICKRTDAFSAISKILLMSTPTSHETSRIWHEFLQTDQSYYHVPCPHCATHQRLLWGGPDCDFGMKWTNHDPATAHYLCAHCHMPIPETSKTVMLANGVWRPTYPQITDKRGFQLSSLYSPYGWVSWPQMVDEFLSSHDKPRKLKVFVNTRLGETYEEKGQQPAWSALQSRAEQYTYWNAPAGVGFVTAGVDVQTNRLAVSIKGWGEGEESWLLWWGELFGNTDTEDADVWTQLSDLMNRPIRHAYGFDLLPVCIAVDSGDNTHTVYNFVRRRHRYIAIKGQSVANKPILGRPTKQDVDYRGSTIPNGVDLWPVGVYEAKTLIYERLEIAKPGPEYCHFPIDADKDYFRQLTSEKKITRYDQFGFPVRKFVLPNQRRNEGLDCEVYALAAAIKVGLQRLNWSELKENFKKRKDTLAGKAYAKTVSEPAPIPVPVQTSSSTVPVRQPKPPMQAPMPTARHHLRPRTQSRYMHR